MAASRGDAEGQDIIVKAQRIMNVPLPIQAISGEALANKGINPITSLRFNKPGLTMAPGSGFVEILIRGIGNTIYVGADPAVACFVDDVPKIYGSMTDNFGDVERVEVLMSAPAVADVQARGLQ